MFHLGEPLLQPLLIAMALIYLALISHPIWASDNPGQLAQSVPIEYVDTNNTRYGHASTLVNRYDMKYGYHMP